jgi:prolyl oligopeptidase
MKSLIASLYCILMTMESALAQTDPYQWLENVDDPKALAFVETQNQKTEARLKALSIYDKIYSKSLEILNSNNRIAAPAILGGYIYNFWRDKDHVRGIWRRSPRHAYLQGKPVWETLLDIDALSAKDNVKWVFKGASGLYPDYIRFMVSLSKGGGDAVVVREFDVNTRSFVDGGFEMPEAKGGATYVDGQTLIVSTNFGPGTMTSSGYARQVKIWKRGTPLSSAKLVFEGDETDVASSGFVVRDREKTHVLFRRGITFYTGEYHAWVGEKPVRLDIPADADMLGILHDQVLVWLKSDWFVNSTLFKQGSLISLDYPALLSGVKKALLVWEPDARSSLAGTSTTQQCLLVNILNNVKNELYTCRFSGGAWTRQKVNAPDYGAIYLGSTDEQSDLYFFTFTNFLTPSTLYQGDATANTISVHTSLQAYFDAAGLEVEQYEARSTDGTMIPYFIVHKKSLPRDGKQPTLLYAYGGFEVPSLPNYSGIIGNAWLAEGGVYVLANIRGGGEFGPGWHQAGLKENRQRVYDDFHAVAADLIRRKITSARHLGIMGGSNGGLLVGVAFTQRPELYGAVVCQVPLLDMQRYNKLLAGASWMGEYGDPDKPEEWAYIQKYSPYHNLKKGMNYPEVFFYTSTRDDRVHPGHARKMAAKMMDMGYPVLYYENTEGGHAGASTNEQTAKFSALQYSYLWMKLK